MTMLSIASKSHLEFMRRTGLLGDNPILISSTGTEEPAMIKKETQGDNFYQGYYTPPRDWVPRTTPYIAFGPIQGESLQSKATATFGREGAGGDSGESTRYYF